LSYVNETAIRGFADGPAWPGGAIDVHQTDTIRSGQPIFS